jgi:hypothetical protein
MDGDIVIDIRIRIVIFHQWGVIFNYIESEEPSKSPRYILKWISKFNIDTTAKSKSIIVKIINIESGILAEITEVTMATTRNIVDIEIDNIDK